VVPDGPLQAEGRTVRNALGVVFDERPHARSYVLDDQGNLRKHVCIFADGVRLPHEAALATRIKPGSKLYVMQALSGGFRSSGPPPSRGTSASAHPARKLLSCKAREAYGRRRIGKCEIIGPFDRPQNAGTPLL
jgi:sulfur-carrier protein